MNDLITSASGIASVVDVRMTADFAAERVCMTVALVGLVAGLLVGAVAGWCQARDARAVEAVIYSLIAGFCGLLAGFVVGLIPAFFVYIYYIF